MAKGSGHWKEPFADVKGMLQSFIDAGEEYGGSITVNLKSRDVVDIWAGQNESAKP